MTKTIQKTTMQFKEVNSTTVFIAKAEADYADSMALLRQNGLRALARQEALVFIDANPQLKEQLKGKWFYLAGTDLEESGYHTFDDKGNLIKGQGEIEKTIYGWPGKNPLSLYVRSADNARILGGRFGLVARDGPQDVAPMVVGVGNSHEVATPEIEASGGTKIDQELVSEFRSVVAKMDSAAQAGVLNTEITEVAKRVLRAIE